MGANRFYSAGHRVDHTPTAAVAAGDIVVLGPSLLGYAHDAISANAKGSVQIDGLVKLVKTTGALSVGDHVYWDATNGRVDADPSKGAGPLKVVVAAASGDTLVVCKLNPYAKRGLSWSPGAAGSTVTNTTTETDFSKTATIPANTLKVGDVVTVRGAQTVPNTNSTDTLAIKTYFGANTAGTALLAANTGAVDVADNDVGYQEYHIEIRSVGATGSAYPIGFHVLDSTTTVFTKLVGTLISNIDTTKNIVVKQSATWSVANAGNNVTQQTLQVKVNDKP